MERAYIIAFALLLSCALPSFAASPLRNAEHVVVSITLNTEPKGEFFIFVTPEGDYWVKVQDLQAMGLREPAGKRIEIDGEPYLSLQLLPGVEVQFDEKTLSLEIRSAPELLPKETFDLQPQPRKNVRQPRDNSAFLNYGVSYAGNTSGTPGVLTVTPELGARVGDFLFQTDGVYTTARTNEPFVRFATNVTYDNRDTLQRWIVGDFFASSGELGGFLNLGGISVSKVYSIAPYFIKRPLASIAGAVALPSEAEVYLDNVRVAKEKLAPGAFELRNLDYYGGLRDVTVIIKDRFGREQVFSYPYYFTDVLLRQGLHEYSYNLGFRREDFGVASNHYGGLALSALHRYGVTNDLTLGLRGEATTKQGNFGPVGLYRLATNGVLSMSLAVGHDEAHPGIGLAGSLGYSYQWRGLNTQFLLRGFNAAYPVLGRVPTTARPKL
jgi:outer membrane usher protein